MVINLAMHNNGALKEEDKIVTQLGMRYIHIPVVWKEPKLEDLDLFIALLKTLQKQKKKVFIHCIKNHRVSVFMYLYHKKIKKSKDFKPSYPEDFKPNKIWKTFIANEEKR